jgi:hypothetical protein
VRLRSWEVGVALIGAAFALIFLASNTWGVGIGLLCADALWLLTRVRIVELPGRPGRYATLRGRLGLVKLILLLGVYAAVIYGIVIVQADGPNLRIGVVASFALVGLAFMLLNEATRSGKETTDWLIGGLTERRVGEALDALAAKGWVIVHGYKRPIGGDIDHALAGPGGVFVVETKSHSYRRRDLSQVAWNAAWLKEQLGVHWVTAVLCVRSDEPPRCVDDKFWIVGHRDIVAFVESQHGPTIDPHRLRELLVPERKRGRFRRAFEALRTPA